AHGYTLYVAVVDATNTFPSRDQPTPVEIIPNGYYWLCNLRLAEDVAYYARDGNMQSDTFRPLIGLLTGDPASPIL
ncbi:hypothetical protein B0H19DRAFT_916627, partial [Mycena capillaripes]